MVLRRRRLALRGGQLIFVAKQISIPRRIPYSAHARLKATLVSNSYFGAGCPATFLPMSAELPTSATSPEAPAKAANAAEQTSQAALAGAIGLIVGARTDDPTVKGIVAALAPFASLGIFWLVRLGSEEFKAYRKRRGLADYLRQIEDKAARLPTGSDERRQLESDAREVSRIRHQYIVRELTGILPAGLAPPAASDAPPATAADPTPH